MTTKPKLVRGGRIDTMFAHGTVHHNATDAEDTGRDDSGHAVMVDDCCACFTDEEKSVYEAMHAPVGNRLVASLSEAWLPLLAFAIIVASVAFMLIMRLTNTLLVVLAVLLASLLMGTIVYVSYEEQRKAHDLADKAEAIYETAMGVKRRSGDGTATPDE